MSKSEFYDWKRHPVTIQVFSQLQARVNEIKDRIVSSARDGDPRHLAHLAGAVDAYNDMLLTEYEESHGD